MNKNWKKYGSNEATEMRYRSNGITWRGALAFIFGLYCLYLAIACYALATNKLVIDARGVESYYTYADAIAVVETIENADKTFKEGK